MPLLYKPPARKSVRRSTPTPSVSCPSMAAVGQTWQPCSPVWIRFRLSQPSRWVQIAAIAVSGSSSPSPARDTAIAARSEEHTFELQSPDHLVCRLLLEKKKSSE